LIIGVGKESFERRPERDHTIVGDEQDGDLGEAWSSRV
jgi:hypothetical protein